MKKLFYYSTIFIRFSQCFERIIKRISVAVYCSVKIVNDDYLALIEVCIFKS